MLSLFVFVLVYNRRDLSQGIYTSGFAKAVRCLTGGYKEKYYYWESVSRPLKPKMASELIALLTRLSSLRSNRGDAAPCRVWLGGAHSGIAGLLPPHLLARHLCPLPRRNGRRAALPSSRGQLPLDLCANHVALFLWRMHADQNPHCRQRH